MIKMMIGLLAAMVFVLAVQAQAGTNAWLMKNVTSIEKVPIELPRVNLYASQR